MKTWMKILMWLGLGGGIGFFGGYRIGRNSAEKEHEHDYADGYNVGLMTRVMEEGQPIERPADHIEEKYEKAVAAMQEYSGSDSNEEPEMPEEPPVIGDEDVIEATPTYDYEREEALMETVPEVPQIHATHMAPVEITEAEYYENPWNYDKEEMIFYEGDSVLFNVTTHQKFETRDALDQAIGVGMTYQFYKNVGPLNEVEPEDTIYVRNDIMGILVRVDRMNCAFDDPVGGGNAPEYEDEDE